LRSPGPLELVLYRPNSCDRTILPMMRWQIAHERRTPKERLSLSTRASTNKDATPPGPVCGPEGGCSPRGHSGILWGLSEGVGAVPETDEPASGSDELDDHRTQLGESQVERDRLRAELRDALSQLEYWRTLAEYREAMLDELRGNTDRGRESPSPGHPAERPPRRLRRRA